MTFKSTLLSGKTAGSIPSYNGLLLKVLSLNIAAIVITVALSAPFDKVYRQFEDGGFITYFSVIQLFILSHFAYKIFKVRSQSFPHPWRSSIAIWAIMSLGFSFLALDDLLMIHEWLDKVIHGIGQFEETAVSDRLDDVIIGFYGLVSIGGLVHYRKEIKKYRAVLPLVVIGFVLLFATVGIDILTNRDDILSTMFSPETTANMMYWMVVPEEGLKLLSEAFLIVAIHTCHIIAKSLRQKDLGRNGSAHQLSPQAISRT
ncbi:MAG: hypothetical protein AAFY72_17370 [Cyanobacteria bacterium J06649_4]